MRINIKPDRCLPICLSTKLDQCLPIGSSKNPSSAHLETQVQNINRKVDITFSAEDVSKFRFENPSTFLRFLTENILLIIKCSLFWTTKKHGKPGLFIGHSTHSSHVFLFR